MSTNTINTTESDKFSGMEVLFTEKEVMTYLKCGRSTLLELCHPTRGNYWMKKSRIRIGTYVYRKSMVNSYIQSLEGIK